MSQKAVAQSLVLEESKNIGNLEIPFNLENNFIVVDVFFQDLLPAKFIFDTGAEHSILCKKEYAEIMGIRYDREFKIMGADLKTELKAYLTKNVSLKIKSSTWKLPSQDILVLGDDYFKLDESSGVPIAGILGADLFNTFVLKIDYQRKVIKLLEANDFKKPKGFQVFDIEIKNGKPYLFPNVFINKNDSLQLKLLLDTGASLSLLLLTNTHPNLKLPNEYIIGTVGSGLGGTIDGYKGRVNQLSISPTIQFNNIIADFQDFNTVKDSSLSVSRNGIIGSGILSRFTIYIDYLHEKLYLKPNAYFKKQNKTDKSGLSIVATGNDLNTFMIQSVIPGSPANWSDIRKDDQILSINRIPANVFDLKGIFNILQGKTGKRLRIVVKRNGYKFVKYLVLKELI